MVEKSGDVLRRVTVEDGRVDVDFKALRLRRPDGRNRYLEDPFLRNRFVMMLFHAVEMDGEEQIGRWLEQMQLLFEKQRVGAERNEFFSRDNSFDDLADFLVNKRLTARNGDHWSAAFIDRLQALSDREALV